MRRTGTPGRRDWIAASPAAMALRRLAFGVFYALPPSVRRRVVRVAVGKYIVGAVALVRDEEAASPGRLLLVRQPPGLGWSLPAGLLRRGESPLLGCLRELAEETGLVLGRDELTPANPNAVIHYRGRWVDVVFQATVASSQVVLRVDGAEVIEAGWHRLDRLPPLTAPTARLLAHYAIGPYADYPEVRTP